MKKILAISALIFLCSCTNSNTDNTSSGASVNQNTKQTMVSTGVSVENFSETLKKSSKKITETDEFNACLQPYVNMCVQSVASDLAQKTKNPEICGELADKTARGGCQLGVILSQIQQTKANELQTSSCDIIEEDSLKKTCKSQIITLQMADSENISGCDEIAKLYENNAVDGKHARNVCIMNIATASKKAQHCNAISDEMEKKMCISTIEFETKMTPVNTPTTASGSAEKAKEEPKEESKAEIKKDGKEEA